MNTTSSIIKLPCPSYSIEINTAAATGYFESNLRGDEDGGGLWFTSADGVLTLIDYDGVFALPPAVVKALRAGNIIVPDEFAPPQTAAGNYKGKPSNRWILVFKDEVLYLAGSYRSVQEVKDVVLQGHFGRYPDTVRKMSKREYHKMADAGKGD